MCVSHKLKGPSLKVVNEQLAATLQDSSKSLGTSWFCLGAYALTWISNITVFFDLIPQLNANVFCYPSISLWNRRAENKLHYCSASKCTNMIGPSGK